MRRADNLSIGQDQILHFDNIPMKYCRMAKRKNGKSKLPEQVSGDGYLVGYARVSTEEQSLDLQLDALRLAGVHDDQIWQEKKSGANRKRPRLKEVLAFLDEGDTLFVWRLDRVARSLRDLLDILHDLDKRGVKFVSLTENIETVSAAGRLVLHVMGAMAEFENAMEVTIKGGPLSDPRQRVLAIEAAMQAICENVDEDSADGVMALMTAAVHIYMRQSKQTVAQAGPQLAHTLGCAIVAADDFFKLRTT